MIAVVALGGRDTFFALRVTGDAVADPDGANRSSGKRRVDTCASDTCIARAFFAVVTVPGVFARDADGHRAAVVAERGCAATTGVGSIAAVVDARHAHRNGAAVANAAGASRAHCDVRVRAARVGAGVGGAVVAIIAIRRIGTRWGAFGGRMKATASAIDFDVALHGLILRRQLDVVVDDV